MAITKDSMKTMRIELTALFNDYAKVSGLTMEIGSIKFDEGSFKFTVNGVDRSLPGDDVISTEFILNCTKYGFVPADLGRMFMGPKGDVYTICGLKKKNRKYPIIAENIDTKKRFKFAGAHVKAMLAANVEKTEVANDSDSEHITE